MASHNEECFSESPSSSKICSQPQKVRLCLRSDRRHRNVRPSPAPVFPDSEEKGEDAARATVSGGGAEIVVADANHAIQLYAMGNFGTFVGQRMNFANLHCFKTDSADKTTKQEEQHMQDESEPSVEQLQKSAKTNEERGEEDTTKRKAKESAAEWIARTTGGGAFLHLSPEEALYLSHDLKLLTLSSKQNDATLTDYSPEQFFADLCVHPNFASILYRYLVYRYFRRLCWIVRDGISFGVDFLLYKCSVDEYHSSAGVRIVHSAHEPIATETSIGALQRELANCKKRLLLANVVGLPGKLQNLRLTQLGVANVQVLSMSIWNANRSRISDLDGQELQEDD
ncbi:hypothetical protein niasHT_037962 [Heterodera trifolii]|uniref:tRNA-intron lyase n=1 Tax=Heterodera trifolii TaxID=157864 RepID=A0ABD2HNE7_9BILA